MADKDIALMAHLMRRAGFSATRDELERYVAKKYEAKVEELLHPENQPEQDQDLWERYMPEYSCLEGFHSDTQLWVTMMINSNRPLQEKMCLFWHGIMCTGFAKVDHGRQMTRYIELFREHGMGNYRTLLLELSRHPSMVYYLDNCESHKDSVNENYGRELIEPLLPGRGHGRQGQLHRGRRQGLRTRLHRLEPGAHLACLPLWPLRLEFPLRRIGPRQRRRKPSWARRALGTAKTL